MTDNVVKFPNQRIDEINNKKVLERLIHAKYAMVSIVNPDDTIAVVGINADPLKGISLCAASIDAIAKDIDEKISQDK